MQEMYQNTRKNTLEDENNQNVEVISTGSVFENENTSENVNKNINIPNQQQQQQQQSTKKGKVKRSEEELKRLLIKNQELNESLYGKQNSMSMNEKQSRIQDPVNNENLSVLKSKLAQNPIPLLKPIENPLQQNILSIPIQNSLPIHQQIFNQKLRLIQRTNQIQPSSTIQNPFNNSLKNTHSSPPTQAVTLDNSPKIIHTSSPIQSSIQRLSPVIHNHPTIHSQMPSQNSNQRLHIHEPIQINKPRSLQESVLFKNHSYVHTPSTQKQIQYKEPISVESSKPLQESITIQKKSSLNSQNILALKNHTKVKKAELMKKNLSNTNMPLTESQKDIILNIDKRNSTSSHKNGNDSIISYSITANQNQVESNKINPKFNHSSQDKQTIINPIINQSQKISNKSDSTINHPNQAETKINNHKRKFNDYESEDIFVHNQKDKQTSTNINSHDDIDVIISSEDSSQRSNHLSNSPIISIFEQQPDNRKKRKRSRKRKNKYKQDHNQNPQALQNNDSKYDYLKSNNTKNNIITDKNVNMPNKVYTIGEDNVNQNGLVKNINTVNKNKFDNFVININGNKSSKFNNINNKKVQPSQKIDVSKNTNTNNAIMIIDSDSESTASYNHKRHYSSESLDLPSASDALKKQASSPIAKTATSFHKNKLPPISFNSEDENSPVTSPSLSNSHYTITESNVSTQNNRSPVISLSSLSGSSKLQNNSHSLSSEIDYNFMNIGSPTSRYLSSSPTTPTKNKRKRHRKSKSNSQKKNIIVKDAIVIDDKESFTSTQSNFTNHDEVTIQKPNKNRKSSSVNSSSKNTANKTFVININDSSSHRPSSPRKESERTNASTSSSTLSQVITISDDQTSPVSNTPSSFFMERLKKLAPNHK